MTPTVVLSVAGTDSGGAAGLAADLTTFAAHGTHGALVVTAVTAQDTTGVHAIHVPPYDVVAGQLEAVLDDLPVAAAKTGMLGSPETVRLVAERLGHLLLVVDPVLVATSGAVLGNEAVRAAYVDHLLPVATVTTPNLDEARALLGCEGAPDQLAAKLAALGPAVVLTGGLEWVPEPTASDAATGLVCTDWLALPGEEPLPLSHPALPTTNDHGTGCTFSAALAALLARGLPIPAAIRRAAAYTSSQLALSRRWDLGRGRGPIAHLTPLHHRHEETP
ncbi:MULTISPECIES: bifunctional hydroxymethylpyrimidine kinase/phosphomethylpyrimidine kinase [unclassified Nocardioides]|uniref:bifunctional hydroxymethylpyrimidine kinase/phosphomethylpyrimidine kinase n=1 Tax=unclassified Nocardioides TaxID=2615069 RepID=UPI0006F36E47|nr:MULTISPECIES: bifunctional hydroxymethylpyrimidine kinase/phosphomethylpyrimidine kinase [unclassified Nocardioides]KQY56381.1 phosphomethylpyrimidine kinase [Nocardioides sp. Root140]KRF14244.1 phosphomethylpyrimidine kinase [Nocardioides sp. Soil796]